MSFLFGKKTFRIVRGTRWTDEVTITDEATGEAVDLNGIVRLIARVREFIDSSEVLLELTTTDTTLTVVNAAGGVVGIDVPTAATLDFPENGHFRAVYVYDVLIERSPGEYEPGLGGKVVVLPQVTRAASDP